MHLVLSGGKSIIILLYLLVSINIDASSNDAACSSFIIPDYVEITKVNCATDAEICLEIPFGDIITYTVSDNGIPYSGGVNACDFDTSFAYTYFSLPGAGMIGPYMIDAWSVDGNIFSGQVANMSDLVDSMNTWDPVGNWMLDNPTSSIRGGTTLINYGDMIVTQVSSNISTTINVTTSLNPHGSLMTLDTGYHQLIFTEPVDGCLDTVIVVVNCSGCPELYSGDSNLMAINCSSNTAVCFDIPIVEIADYTITDNGIPYVETIKDCAVDSTFSYDFSGLPGQGNSGPYQLQHWMVNGSVFIGVFVNLTELVAAMNIWDPGGNWTLDLGTLTISGGNGANVYSNIDVLQISSGDSGSAVVNATASVSSIELQLAPGNHEVIFLNNQNLCKDTVALFIDCIPCPEIFDGNPVIAESVHCDSIAEVCLPVSFAEIADYSVEINEVQYSGGFQSCGSDSTIIALDTGFYHIVFTHSITACQDSVDVTVTCVPDVECEGFLSDEIRYLRVDDCIEMAAMCIAIPIDSISEYTIFDNNILYGNSVEVCESDTLKASLNLGQGTHQLIFEQNVTGCRDTIEAMVACISTESMDLMISVNSADTICFDTTELMGEVISFENICENASGEFSLIELDSENYCLSYTGIEEGIENACIVLCDDLGYCDTTFLNLSVEPVSGLLPNAVDDFETTTINTQLNISVLANDEINGVFDTLYLHTLPSNGTVTVNVDRTISYDPGADFCNSIIPDEFAYLLCNENGCDSATVSVTINCEELRIHNGFSPNNDGTNDSFVIIGAQDLPGNKLFIYNRWGLLVHQAADYQNDWKGTWKGTDLADGTYFYLFEDGKGKLYSGYVQIHR